MDSNNKLQTKASEPAQNHSDPTPAEPNTGWDFSNKSKESILDQVKEAADSALNQCGMVYVESAGMYYDSKTGYYYNPVSLPKISGS